MNGFQKAGHIFLVAMTLFLGLSVISAKATTITPIQDAEDFFIASSPGDGMFVPSNEDGTFGAETESSELRAKYGVDVADMDNDGDNDILQVSDRRIFLYTNEGDGTYTKSLIYTSDYYFGSIYLRVGDFNEDGRMDFVTGDVRLQRGVHIYLQTESGAFEQVSPGLDLDVFLRWDRRAGMGVAVGDLDGDGHLDIMMIGYGGWSINRLAFYKGDGTGKMAPPVLVKVFKPGDGYKIYAPSGIALFDLEGDGDLDLVIGGSSYYRFHFPDHYVFLNDGQGNFTFQTESSFYIYGTSTVIDSCDFDRDGDHDLVVAAKEGKTVYYVENLGGELAYPLEIAYSDFEISGIGASPIGSKAKSPEEIIENLVEEVQELPVGTLTNPNQANALGNKFQAILDDLNSIGDETTDAEKLTIYEDAVKKLQNDILRKTDGLYGGRLKDDWVTTQEGQDLLYPQVVEAIELLENAIETLTL